MSSTTAFIVDSQVRYQKILIPHYDSMMSEQKVKAEKNDYPFYYSRYLTFLAKHQKISNL